MRACKKIISIIMTLTLMINLFQWSPIKASPNSYIVVTGGGTAANNPDVTEGGLMGEWLLAQGVQENRIIIENNAADTVGNAENTYAILNEQYPNVDSIVLVTSDYHVPRGCLLYNSKFILEALENNSEPLTKTYLITITRNK